VSPLKALSNDILRNLERPLAGIKGADNRQTGGVEQPLAVLYGVKVLPHLEEIEVALRALADEIHPGDEADQLMRNVQCLGAA
jgi:hypothetical protein